MLLTESSTVIKSNGNPDVEIFSETSLSHQNTHKEGISIDTRHTNLVSGDEAENTAKGKTSGHISGFSATDSAREKSSRKWRLEADSKSVSEKSQKVSKSQRRNMMTMETSKGFVQPQNMTILSGIPQKI